MDRRFKPTADRRAPAAPAVLVRAFQTFFRREASSGVVLLVCAVAALIWANSPQGHTYFDFWNIKFAIGDFDWTLRHWVNEALMAIFFLVVGLEVKREVLCGELSSPKGAALPIVGALGGMIVPALIYVAVAASTGGGAESRRGWAVPMATDIAFALGVLALIGRRVPIGLKVFLSALAIADDLGAILVIAIFYTSNLSAGAFAAAGACMLVLIAGNRLGIRRSGFYMLVGIALWVAMYKSGIHATMAGVLLAMAIPARRQIDEAAFTERARGLVDAFAAGTRTPGDRNLSSDQHDAVASLEHACAAVSQPLHRLERSLHPWVAFGIMPLFALANTGVYVSADTARAAVSDPTAIGAFVGLLVGKQIGVFAFAWLAVRIGMARLPSNATWLQLYGIACLCGIGFTMSLFIAGLAFRSAQVLDHAKLAIFAASTLAGVVGAVVLVLGRKPAPAPRTAGLSSTGVA